MKALVTGGAGFIGSHVCALLLSRGHGKQRRDFVFVSDVAAAFYRAARSRLSGHAFNVGTGRPRVSFEERVRVYLG